MDWKIAVLYIFILAFYASYQLTSKTPLTSKKYNYG